MSVKDDILKGKPKKTATAAPAQQPQAEQVVKQQTQPVATASATQALDQGMKGSVAPATATPGLAKRSNREIIDEIARRTTGYEEPTAEELRKEKKRKAIQQLILSLGDGISAISDMHTAVKYAPYQEKDPKNSLSAANQARWDKFYADREARRQRYQTQFDKLWAEHKADEATAYQRERDRLADERAARAEARAAAQFAWQKENAEKTRAFQAEQGAKARAHAAAENTKQRAAQENIARGRYAQQVANKLRQNPIQFADEKGNPISIYGSVWKGSMQQVFDRMVDAGIGNKLKLSQDSFKNTMAKMNAKQKEDFVKQNWTKDPSVKAYMLSLSRIDPVKEYGIDSYLDGDTYGGSDADYDVMYNPDDN